MKLLLDTNIIIDVISKRDGYEDSLQVLRLCEIGAASGVVTTTTVTDVMYILGKYMDSGAVRRALKTLFVVLDIASVRRKEIMAALDSPMADYEDAVQATCALSADVDYIVTRNTKDFEASPVLAVTPDKTVSIICLN